MSWSTIVWIGAAAIAVWFVASLFRRKTPSPHIERPAAARGRTSGAASVERAIHEAAGGAQRFRPPWPTGRAAARLPPEDQETSSADTREWRLAPTMALHLEYVDVAGSPSERRITLRKYCDDYGVVLVRAWCHEREAWRSFRVDRMQVLTDLSTGEVRTDCEAALIEWGAIRSPQERDVAGAERRRVAEEAMMIADRVARMEARAIEREAERVAGMRTQRAALLARRKAGPVASARELLGAFAPDLEVLVLVARADGRRTKTETAAILDYLSGMLGAAFDRAEATKALGRVTPEPDALDDALAELRDAGALIAIAGAVVTLIEADGKTTPEETAIATALHSALAAAP